MTDKDEAQNMPPIDAVQDEQAAALSTKAPARPNGVAFWPNWQVSYFDADRQALGIPAVSVKAANPTDAAQNAADQQGGGPVSYSGTGGENGGLWFTAQRENDQNLSLFVSPPDEVPPYQPDTI